VFLFFPEEPDDRLAVPIFEEYFLREDQCENLNENGASLNFEKRFGFRSVDFFEEIKEDPSLDLYQRLHIIWAKKISRIGNVSFP